MLSCILMYFVVPFFFVFSLYTLCLICSCLKCSLFWSSCVALVVCSTSFCFGLFVHVDRSLSAILGTYVLIWFNWTLFFVLFYLISVLRSEISASSAAFLLLFFGQFLCSRLCFVRFLFTMCYTLISLSGVHLLCSYYWFFFCVMVYYYVSILLSVYIPTLFTVIVCCVFFFIIALFSIQYNLNLIR